MIGEPKMQTVAYYAVLIQRTESLQNFDIISDTFPSRIFSCPVFKGPKTNPLRFSKDSNLKLYIA